MAYLEEDVSGGSGRVRKRKKKQEEKKREEKKREKKKKKKRSPAEKLPGCCAFTI